MQNKEQKRDMAKKEKWTPNCQTKKKEKHRAARGGTKSQARLRRRQEGRQMAAEARSLENL